MRGCVKGSVEVADELGYGEAGRFAERFQVEGFVVGGFYGVFGDTETFVYLGAGAGFEGVDLCRAGEFGAMGADEVVQEEDEVFIDGVAVVAVGVEVGDEGVELLAEGGVDVIEGLEELDRGRGGAGGVFEDIVREFLFEEDRDDVCGFTVSDLAGIGLIVVQDEELPGADRDAAAVDAIPFFPF